MPPKWGRGQLLKPWSEASSCADPMATVHPPLRSGPRTERDCSPSVTPTPVERGNTEGQEVPVSGLPLCIPDWFGTVRNLSKEGAKRDRRPQVQHSHTHSTLK